MWSSQIIDLQRSITLKDRIIHYFSYVTKSKIKLDGVDFKLNRLVTISLDFSMTKFQTEIDPSF